MPRTAIGLFESPAAARMVAQDLESSGIPPSGIGMIGEPAGLTESESAPGMTTAHTDFEVTLVRDLMKSGVQREEALQYREGVRRGGVLVIAQGSDTQVDSAAETMNRGGAVHVEELLAGTLAHRAGQAANLEINDLSITPQTGRVRYAAGGVRVFVW